MRKSIIVTGATGGIGTAIVYNLIRDGYNVMVHCHEKEINTDKLNSIYASGPGLEEGIFHTYYTDIRNKRGVMEMVEQTIERFGSIDGLINNAGIVDDKTLLKMSNKQWKDVIDVNLNGVFNVTKAALPYIIDSGSGHIVNITSIIGEYGGFGQCNYAASKAALIGFTKSLAKEVGPKGVTVNAIAPGFIDTPMTENIPEAIIKEIEKQIPLGKFGQPHDVADVVSFLLKTTYINGAVIDVNGGMR